MGKVVEFLVRHPALTALTFAVLVGAGGYNAFHAGMAYRGLRDSLADTARAASEALGG